MEYTISVVVKKSVEETASTSLVRAPLECKVMSDNVINNVHDKPHKVGFCGFLRVVGMHLRSTGVVTVFT